jgi:hypothetical protein
MSFARRPKSCTGILGSSTLELTRRPSPVSSAAYSVRTDNSLSLLTFFLVSKRSSLPYFAPNAFLRGSGRATCIPASAGKLSPALDKNSP